MKVKIFSSEYERALEREINEFIEEIEKQHMEVKDIKFSMCNDQAYSNDAIFSALVMYGPDGKIYLTNIPFKYEESN